MDNDQILNFRETFNQMRAPDMAALYASSVGNNQEARVVTIDCTTAKLSTDPYVIGFPFRSFVVISATDSNVTVNLKLSTQDSYQDSIPLKKGTALTLPYPIGKGFIDFTAQAAKSITILFLVTGEFRTNILDLVNSGGVTISQGSTVATSTVSTVTSTAAALLALDTARKNTTIQNQGSIPIFIGGATVTVSTGASPGIQIDPGVSLEWKNTAALYAVATGTNANIAVMAET